MAGLGTPLVNVGTTSDVGQLIDAIISIWMLVLWSIIISTVYQASLVIRLQEKLPNSKMYRFLILFVFVPIVLLLILFCYACIFMFFENWDLKPSLQYVVSAACGLGNPLTDKKPVLFSKPESPRRFPSFTPRPLLRTNRPPSSSLLSSVRGRSLSWFFQNPRPLGGSRPLRRALSCPLRRALSLGYGHRAHLGRPRSHGGPRRARDGRGAVLREQEPRRRGEGRPQCARPPVPRRP